MGGYDQKQSALLRDLTMKMRDFRVNPERFALQKTRLIRHYKNHKTRRPIDQTSFAVNYLRNPRALSIERSISALEDLSLETFQSFVKSYYSQCALEIMIHGNHTAAEALGIASVSSQALLRDVESVSVPSTIVWRLPQNKELICDLDINHDDSTYWAHYQGSKTDLSEQAHYLLLAQIIKTPFFTTLRTHQQLGYLVWSLYDRLDTVPGLSLAIQSHVANPVELGAKVDQFLVDFDEIFSDMSVEDFNIIKSGLIAKLEEKDATLYSRTSSFNSDLALGYTSFDRKAQLISVLNVLEQSQILDFFRRRFLSEQRGRLLVRSFGRAHERELPNLTSGHTADHVLEQLDAVFERSVHT